MTAHHRRDERDERMEALASAERRRLLFELKSESPVENVLDLRDSGNVESASTEFRMKMQHVHLPKLDQYGYVDWDPETETVERGPAFEEIEPVLEMLDRHRDKLGQLTE